MKITYIIACFVFTSQLMAQVTPFSVDANTDAFTGWTEQNTSGLSSQNGRFIGSSGTGMDVSGDSWGLYANSSQTAANVYDFGNTLAVGQSVQISVSLGFIDGGGTVGFGLQNSSNVNRFESYYIGGSTDSWKINDAGGQEDITGVTTNFTNSSWSNSNFLTFTFTQEATNSFSFTVNGTPITNTNLNLAASDISQIRIFNFNAGSNGIGGHDQYFNNLSVIPEPSSIVMLGLTGLAAGGIALLKRRKRA